MASQPYDTERRARQRRWRVLALSLAGLAAFLVLEARGLCWWAARDSRPASWDQSVHLETALDVRQALARGDWSAVWHPRPKPGMPAFPPLYHLALQPAMASADPTRSALWVNFAYFSALTLCLFGLAFGFRDDWTAAAAAIAFVCAPAVQGLLYSQLVDLPVLACSAAAYWAFLASDEFSAWGPSLAFGALFAVGMLHKWSFFSYMIPAYVVTLRALGRPKASKGPLAAAWALAGILTLPWYLANWPLLLPRLFQASADFAVPVWRGAAFLSYFWSSFEGLGPALWLMGWLGLIVPSYRRHASRGGLVPFWVLSAYVFWAIVPNRQMRFLLPGLPGLAVAATGCWPGPLIAGMLGLQLLGADNYARGWFGPIEAPTPFGVATLFPNNLPAAEDWRVDDILREAQRRADPAQPIANLALIANAPYFNGPTFTWRRQALDLPRLRVRGVNRRLCELAQFLVLKQGDLGPASVIGGLPEAALQVQAPGGWFSRSYSMARSWPLPDGSQAVLFERAKPSKPPFAARGPVSFQFYEHDRFSASGLVLDLGRYDAVAGEYPRAKVSARELTLRGLSVASVSAELDGLLAVPAALPPASQWEELRLLKLKTLRLRSLTIEAAALRRFLEERVKGLRLDSLSLDGVVEASGRYRGLPVDLRLSVELKRAPRALALRVLSFKLGCIPLPVAAVNRVKELTIPLEPNPETPFAIELPGLTLKDGFLTVP